MQSDENKTQKIAYSEPQLTLHGSMRGLTAADPTFTGDDGTPTGWGTGPDGTS